MHFHLLAFVFLESVLRLTTHMAIELIMDRLLPTEKTLLLIVYKYVGVVKEDKTFWCLVYYVLTFLSLYITNT